MARWLNKYESEGLALQRKHLGHFLGLYTTEVGNLHQVVFMWGYDSMADREKRRETLAADPAWQQYLEGVWAMDALLSQEIKILRPAAFSPPWK